MGVLYDCSRGRWQDTITGCQSPQGGMNVNDQVERQVLRHGNHAVLSALLTGQERRSRKAEASTTMLMETCDETQRCPLTFAEGLKEVI